MKKILLLGVILCTILTSYGQTACPQSPKYSPFMNNGRGASGAVSWGEGLLEAQGPAIVGSKQKYWVIASTERSGTFSSSNINSHMFKIPVGEDLQTINVFSSPKVNHKSLKDYPALWNQRWRGTLWAALAISTGYVHWGDPDSYWDNKTEYLVVPMTSRINERSEDKLDFGDPAIGIFRASDLSLVGFGLLPGLKNIGQKDVGYCAVNPNSGNLFTSQDETSHIIEYQIPWNSFPRKGYYGKFSIKLKKTHRLKTASGEELHLFNLQGAAFGPNSDRLFLTNGGGRCKGNGADNHGKSTDGIHAFDTGTWREIRRSTNRMYLKDGESNCCQPIRDCFDFTYDFGCGKFEFHSEQIEGIAIDEGEMHVMGVSVGLSGNQAWIEHFNSRIYVDPAHGRTPDWNLPFIGSKSKPFKYVWDAIIFHPAWEGAQVCIKTPGTSKSSVMTVQGKVGYKISNVPKVWKQNKILPDLSILIRSFSSTGGSRFGYIDFILSPDPITPNLNKTKNYITIGSSIKFLAAHGSQTFIVKGLKAPNKTGTYYLGTSVACGPFSSPSVPIKIKIVSANKNISLATKKKESIEIDSAGIEQKEVILNYDSVKFQDTNLKIDSTVTDSTVTIKGKKNNTIKTDQNKISKNLNFDVKNSQPCSNELYKLSAFPNPTSGILHVLFNCQLSENYVIHLIDADGKKRFEKRATATAGINKMDINTTSFSKGFYILYLFTKQGGCSVKIIVN